MTIKLKLTLNVIIVLLIVAAVATTSFVGMGFVRSKLVYLTETSTPFQMRIVELQRAIQGATADLVKVGASGSLQEYEAYRAAAEQSLAEVRNGQEALAALSESSQSEAYGELGRVAAEIIETTAARLNAEAEAVSANTAIAKRSTEASDRLYELDRRIKRLHKERSATFVASLKRTKEISASLREIELVRATLKDLQLGIYETQHAAEKRSIIIARSKVNTAISRAVANGYVKQTPRLLDELKALEERYAELVNLRAAMVGESGVEAGERYRVLNGDIGERLSALLLSIEQEVVAFGSRLDAESSKQEDAFAQANDATSVLTINSDLVSLGLSVEGLATRLFTVEASRDVDAVEAELRNSFDAIGAAKKSLSTALTRLHGTEELKLLADVDVQLTAIRGLLVAKDGVIAKTRHQLAMKANAARASERLRDIVVKQTEQGKSTVVVARGEQEKAIASVNNMVRFSTVLIAAIALGAVILGIGFGAWVYRSISKPLGELIWGADQIAQGNLSCRKDKHRNDEIGVVQKSMCKMVDNLNEIVGKIKSSTGMLASSSKDLSDTATSVEKGSDEQTSQIEQSATAMTQMSQVTLEVAKHASDTSEAAQHMKTLALQGKETMHVTVNELSRFAETVKESASKVESLGQKSEAINKVVIMIKEIADQTNLLALNAAIEAARAGDMGRGFAVVADNVKQLAERTSVATEDIAHTVRAMQSEVTASVGYMKQERESVGLVLEHVNSTLGSIDNIVADVEKVADMVQRIAVATEEQSTTSDEVSRMVETIAGVTRQLNTSVGDIKRISGDLARLASDLDTTAGWFKV